MLSFFKNVKNSLASLLKIGSEGRYDIAFYAEGASDYLFVGALFEELVKLPDLKILYVTSSADDPVLTRREKNLTALFIKDGGMLGYFFQNLDAKIFITTLTDLGHFHFKKSSKVEHYVYLFHSLNSVHMVYRREAFKNYDYILSPAQHITRELRAMEERYGWPEKKIEDTGYARLDDLREHKSSYQNAKLKQILIAPSWGANGLIETGKALEISKDLIESGYKVIIQPHPMTCRKSPEKINEIRKKAESDAGLELNSDITNKAPFFESAFLITDWSGTSYEFAFTHERPVLFIETKAPKCRNEDYKDIDIVPMEIIIRDKIGKVLALDECHKISDIFQDFEARLSAYQALIKVERDNMIFNLDESSVKARAFIMSLLSNFK